MPCHLGEVGVWVDLHVVGLLPRVLAMEEEEVVERDRGGTWRVGTDLLDILEMNEA